MSPRPDSEIAKLGGLTEDQIALRILQSEIKTQEQWARRMDELKEQIDERFSAHEDRSGKKIDGIAEQVRELVHLVRGQTEQNVNWQANVEASQEVWRAALGERLTHQDAYLADTNEKVTDAVEQVAHVKLTVVEVKLEIAKSNDETKDIRHRLQLLTWLFSAVKAWRFTRTAVIDSADSGKKLYSAIAAICGVIMVLWSFLHTMLPTFHYYVIDHHPFHWFF